MHDVSFSLSEDEAQRFDKKVAPGAGDECDLWTAAKNGQGYGVFALRGKVLRAHRISWQRANGREIREGLQINHLCRTPSCTKAAHLQECTPRENTLHGNTIASEQLAKTHCLKGHELTEENCTPSAWAQGGRACLTCNRDTSRERAAAVSAAHKALGMSQLEYAAVFGQSKSVADDIIATFEEEEK
jgi:hypothetical protein